MKKSSIVLLAVFVVIVVVFAGCDNGSKLVLKCECPNGTLHLGEVCCDDRSDCLCTTISATGEPLTEAMKAKIKEAINYLSPVQQAYVKNNLTEIKILPAYSVTKVAGTVLEIRSDADGSGIIWGALDDWCRDNGVAVMKEIDNSKKQDTVRLT